LNTLTPEPDAIAELTTRQRQVWSSGDFSVIGSFLHPVSERLVDAADLHAGWRVLDVATGSGNAAIAAARLGVEAVGIDFVPELLDRGRERAAAERLPVSLTEADAHSLPFADGEFDAVTSVFGVMFAADPIRAADELVRVVRPGGTIALASWRPTGFVGEMFRVMSTHVPSLVRVPSPFVWGTEPGLRALLSPSLDYLQVRERTFTFRYRSPEHFVDVFGGSYGPTVKALDAAGSSRAQLVADLIDLVRTRNRLGNGAVSIPGTYMEAIATRR
jgi:SAM-dependent methyltransferase